MALARIFRRKHNDEDRLSFVWLDREIKNSKEFTQIEGQFRSAVDRFITFTDLDECRKYIESYNKSQRLTIVVSGTLGQELVPQIHDLEHVRSIYVFCFNQQLHEKWANCFRKVKGVFTHINDLATAIQEDRKEKTTTQLAEEYIPISICQRSTSGLDGTFLHLQLLIHVIVGMYQSKDMMNEIIAYWKNQCKGKSKDRAVIKEYQKTYSPWNAIWWYTRESFLYTLLNKALRTLNIDALFYFRYFIRDLHNQLNQNRCLSPVHVYRVQTMEISEMKILETSIGQMISMNSFVSTSTNRKRALSFLKPHDEKHCSVLFEIYANPSHSNAKPFANIQKMSYFPIEEEVLFTLGSIFHLRNIDRDETGVYIIQLKLCEDDDGELKILFEHMRKQVGGSDSMLSFGNVLLQMGKVDDAERYYKRGLSELMPQNVNVVYYYHGLGLVCKDKGNNEESLNWFQKCLDLYQRTGNQNEIASIYNNIGVIYVNKCDYKQAHDAHNMALAIYVARNGEDDSDVAICLNNIGAVYYHEKNYLEALIFYEKAFDIWRRKLPPHHPQLSGSYSNIGATYLSLKDYTRALEYYNSALLIKKKTLLPENPNIAAIYQSIGLAHEYNEDLKEALCHYQMAAAIYHQIFPPNHRSVLEIDQHIQRINI